MSEITTIVQGVITGLVAGGASAATTVGASWRDFKKRLSSLEDRVGSPGSPTEPKTGLFLMLATLESSFRGPTNELTEGLKKLRREVDNWADDPPDWAMRIGRTRSSSVSINMEIFQELEGRVDSQLKSLSNRLKNLEESLDEHTRRSKKEGCLTLEEYQDDSRKRAEEITKIRENLSVANGFLRGVMAAMGYIDHEEPPTNPGIRRK